MLKYMRIAVTALCLTACVLLVALWVRSYWWRDFLFGRFDRPRAYQFESIQGQLYLSTFLDSGWPGWRRDARPVDYWYAKSGRPAERPALRFHWGDSLHYTGYHGVILCLPHWSLVAVSGLLVASPWLPWSRRFSLRTLMTATALVAVALGVVVMSR
jgi:hypothetical protein